MYNDIQTNIPKEKRKALLFVGGKKRDCKTKCLMTKTNITHITLGHSHSTIVLKIYWYFSYDAQWSIGSQNISHNCPKFKMMKNTISLKEDIFLYFP